MPLAAPVLAVVADLEDRMKGHWRFLYVLYNVRPISLVYLSALTQLNPEHSSLVGDVKLSRFRSSHLEVLEFHLRVARVRRPIRPGARVTWATTAAAPECTPAC